MRIIVVTIEWPGGCEVATFEIEDDATDERIEAQAEALFFDRCNHGWHRSHG